MTNTPQMIDECLVEHLPYEIGMLRLAMDMILQAEGPGIQMNVGIELFCVHARNLIEFFKNQAGFKPGEFTDPSYKRPKHPWFSDQTSQRIANEIAHLTRHRFTDAETRRKITNQDCLKFYGTIEEEIGRFEGALTPDNKTKYKVLCYPVKVPSDRPPLSATNAIQIASSTSLFNVVKVGSY